MKVYCRNRCHDHPHSVFDELNRPSGLVPTGSRAMVPLWLGAHLSQEVTPVRLIEMALQLLRWMVLECIGYHWIILGGTEWHNMEQCRTGGR